MSRTSLGQKNELKQREEASSLRQLQSIRRPNYQEEYFQTHIKIYQEVEYFLHMKDKYLKVQKQTRFFDFDRGSGESYSNIIHGFGIYIFKNGDRYIGFWENNTMNGMGIYVFKSFDDSYVYAYLGEFHNGKFNGIGKLVKMQDDQNGEIIYIGTWIDGKKQEQGIYFYENPHVYYQGAWFKDEKSGEGKLIFNNGDYVGQWQNNVRQGQGKLKKINLDTGITLVYEGFWDSDQLNDGEIIYLDTNGIEMSRYKGSLLNGKKHGQGVYTWSVATFTGHFQDDQIKGEGTLKTGFITITGFFYSNKQVIEDAQNLYAEINYDNNDTYEGIVSISQGNVLRQKGKYRFANGDITQGTFNDNAEGKLEGSFNYKWKNGDQSNF